jgi:DNA-binding FrmR family transcriptional regulator
MINKEVETVTISRLKKIEGQVKGIQKMIEERRYCIDVVMQIGAAESALHTVAEIILKNHLQTCVRDAFLSKNEREREKKISELMEVYKNLRKH